MKFLGLHLDKQSLSLALVTKEKTNFKIEFLESFSLELEAETKAFQQQLQLLYLKEQPFFVGTALETSQILLRTLEMPLKSKAALFKILPFQLENIIPYPLEEVIIVPTIKSLKGTTNSIVTLFCAQEKICLEHLAQLKSYGIDPGWVGCVPQALYRFAKNYTQEEEYILLHMAGRATHVIAVIDDRLSSAFQIELGKEDFLEALAQDYPSLEHKELSVLFYKNRNQGQSLHFEKKIERFVQELDRVFYFLLHKKEGKRLDKILLTKEEEFLMQFKKSMEQSLDCSLQFVELKNPSLAKLKNYAVSIGTAIDTLSDDHKTLQFRTSSNIETTLKQQIIKKIGMYALTVALCSLVIGGCAHLFLTRKEKNLRHQLTTILSRYAQELGEVESHTNLFSTLSRAEKKVNHIKKPYGYYLMPTRVGDFLSYMDEQIVAVNARGIKLEQFQYELVQYPSLEEPLQPYKIKVQLKIQADDETLLAELFQALLSHSHWVTDHPKPTITKEAHQYEAVFFLTAS